MRYRLLAPLLGFVVTVILTTPVGAETLKFSHFAVEVPAGYKNHPGRGIDSTIGVITTPNERFSIAYDVGAMAGEPEPIENLSKEALRQLVYYEAIGSSEIPVSIFASRTLRSPDNANEVDVWIYPKGMSANFFVIAPKKKNPRSLDISDLREILSILHQLRFFKAE